MPDTPNPTSLPIIDISPYLSPTSTPSSRAQVSTALSHACTTYGFFYLTGHGIPQATLSEVLSLARAFFALPLAQKNKIKRYDAGGVEGGDGARGYQGMGENVTMGRRDRHEAVDLYREWDHAGREEGKGERERGSRHRGILMRRAHRLRMRDAPPRGLYARRVAGSTQGWRDVGGCGSGAWRVCGEHRGYGGEVDEWDLEEYEA
ncbi:hypothetical protein GRF29_44g2471131 [Pseudopithomyces chartarum]|uniref:Non-haem dioxygenase N-terminal domain-containing protein n=1 Tax=Pseudopithomyces chartarum TaxID=1892770 RepID=A0AAN6LZG6_9PLEO|nr:hypothetical protein GRF29_44g2471131 [Pseudopithomyces chartarum]